MKQCYTISRNIFLVHHEGCAVLWNTKTHEQYVLSEEHWTRLFHWMTSERDLNPTTKVDQDFIETGTLIDEKLIESNQTSEWGWDLLSYLFHTGTNDIVQLPEIILEDKDEKKYEEFCSGLDLKLFTEHRLKSQKNSSEIRLEKPKMNSVSMLELETVLLKRKTTRIFEQTEIDKTALEQILFWSFFRIHPDWPDLDSAGYKVIGYRRSSPSAGGLHPTNAYVLLSGVKGIKDGIYFYNDFRHSLVFLDELPQDTLLSKLLLGQNYATNSNIKIFFAADFRRTWWKYQHSRGYRSVLLDVGHLSQTVLLTATALGLQTWVTGAFADHEVSKLLKLESPQEAPLFFVALGRSSSNSSI